MVSGGGEFADVKLMDRALDALHRRKGVEMLITGTVPDAQEMRTGRCARASHRCDFAHAAGSEGRMYWSRWSRDVLKRFQIDGLEAFPGKVQTEHLAELAEYVGLRMWRMPIR